MAEEAKQPIIIKKIKKGGHGHHGGAWKIAYADFVTAMMAFFLLLWLLNSVTQEQLEGISNYFAPVSASKSTSGSGDILGGKTIAEPGASQSSTSRDSVSVDLPPPKAGKGSQENQGATENEAESTQGKASEEALKQAEQQQFEKAKQDLENTIAGIPNMKRLQESLMIDNTPEGLRIQLVDQDGLAMFPSGSAEMYLHTRRLLELVAKVISSMPQQISVSGHTDAVPFVSDAGYSNGELSADRANSARRALNQYKVPESRFSRVVGKAAIEPLLPDDPKNARNRRLSIILLRGTGENNPAAPSATGGAAGKAKQDEALPGLNDIKRRQLDEQMKSAPPVQLKLESDMQAQ
jgi:chemotaxis protein MotB